MLRHQLEQLATVAIGHHVERSVWSFLDVADPRVELHEKTLFADHSLPVQHETRKVLARQRRDEQIFSRPGRSTSRMRPSGMNSIA